MEYRHLFNHDELSRYFDRIALPGSQRIYDASTVSDDEKLAYLNLLQKHQLCKVPWENLTQHYSFHRTVNVRPKHLYSKIVGNKGRGGYCMEANYFFHLILLALKYDPYIAGARIYSGSTNTYGGWTHTVNVVTIGDMRYLLDGGMGPTGPNHPLPMRDGVTATQIAPAQMRVTREVLPQQLNKSQKIWIYSHRYDESREWTPVYCFTDLEFLPEDIESMNFEPWLNPRTFFTHKVVCVRFSTAREIDSNDKPGSPDESAMSGEIDGTMTLNHDVFKWRKHGQKVVEIKIQTEKDRIEILKKYFGIQMTEQDQESILGTAAQIGLEISI